MPVEVLWFKEWCEAYGGRYAYVKLEDGSKVYVCFYPHKAVSVRVTLVKKKWVEVCGEPPSKPECMKLPTGLGTVFAGKVMGYIGYDRQWAEVRGAEIVLWDTFLSKLYVGPRAEMPWPRLAKVVKE